jgi:hypothetical protein
MCSFFAILVEGSIPIPYIIELIFFSTFLKGLNCVLVVFRSWKRFGAAGGKKLCSLIMFSSLRVILWHE